MPTVTNWSHSFNFFGPILSRSHVSAKAIVDSFDAKLHNGDADPDILIFYDFFHPIVVLYDGCYSTWDSLRSSSPANTLGIVQLLEILSSTKIRGWDVAIQVLYPQTTTRYKALLPHRRGPFQAGTIDSRVAAIANLLTSMGTDAALATIKTDVLAFQAQLLAAKTLQVGQLQSIDSAITALEIATVNCTDGMFFVFGGLVKKFYKTPQAVDDYFPIDLMHSTAQTNWLITLVDTDPRFVFKRKQNVADTIRGMNHSTNTVKAYFTNGISTTPEVGAPIVTMPPESDNLYTPAEMGYTDAKRHLYVQNMGVTSSSIEITIM